MKEKIIINIIYFIVSYTLMFLVYYLSNKNKKTYRDAQKQSDVIYLFTKFKLDVRKTKYLTLKKCLNFINPLIISITFIVISNIDSLLTSLLIGFVVMITLIYSIYEILGRILKKKESDNNV